MQLFICQSCGARLYFENHVCQSCNHRLGYLPQVDRIVALVRDEREECGGDPNGYWRAVGLPDLRLRFCTNALYDACNWLLPADDCDPGSEPLCDACRFNRIVPNLGDARNLARWRRIETAKHWLIYTIKHLKLPLPDRLEDPGHGLAFKFLTPVRGAPPPLTGHDEGVIVLNAEEAEDAIRERNRTAMGEPYRTLLGHFRHEIGHFYWDVLVRDTDRIDRCRELFGDDRTDYGAALKHHYAEGAPPDWQENYISAYATAHPWEDFAETWAQYLHIVDTIETANAYGLRVDPPGESGGTMPLSGDFDPYESHPIEDLVAVWLPLSFAMNSLARSMGQNDLYPFIISPPVVEKLGFINEIIHWR